MPDITITIIIVTASCSFQRLWRSCAVPYPWGRWYQLYWYAHSVKCIPVAISKFLHIHLYSYMITHFYALDLCWITDNFGNTPLLEAVKQGHDRVASLLFSKGAKLNLENAGIHLCMAVSKRETDFIRGALAYGADPNSKDYDHRHPLHIAASEGLYIMAKLLVDAGASVLVTDRYHQTILHPLSMLSSFKPPRV